jgi:hypothetical protein
MLNLNFTSIKIKVPRKVLVAFLSKSNLFQISYKTGIEDAFKINRC